MTLKEYLFGRQMVLRSPLPADEVSRRVSQAKIPVLGVFSSGVAGWLWLGHVHLRWQTAFFGNGFQPVLAGRLHENLGSTEIRARFGAPLHLRIFLLFWYGFLGLIAFSGVYAIAGDGPKTGNEYLIFIIVPLFAAVPLFFHLVLNRSAETHLDRILDFLRTEALATSEKPGSPPARG